MEMQWLTVILAVHTLIIVPVICEHALTVKSLFSEIIIPREQLDKFHECMCNDSNAGCIFDDRTKTTMSNALFDDDNIYANYYNCSYIVRTISCERLKRSSLAGDEHPYPEKECPSLSLTNRTSCDLECVSMVWNPSEKITITLQGSSIAKCGLCDLLKTPRSLPSSTETALIIGIIVGGSVLIVGVFVVICVCCKRKARFKSPISGTDPSDNSQKDAQKEPLYLEIDPKDQEEMEMQSKVSNTEPAVKNVYDKLHEVRRGDTSNYDQGLLPK